MKYRDRKTTIVICTTFQVFQRNASSWASSIYGVTATTTITQRQNNRINMHAKCSNELNSLMHTHVKYYLCGVWRTDCLSTYHRTQDQAILQLLLRVENHHHQRIPATDALRSADWVRYHIALHRLFEERSIGKASSSKPLPMKRGHEGEDFVCMHDNHPAR